jgi:hypothetical protein
VRPTQTIEPEHSRCSEDPEDVRAWQREREIAGRLYVLTLAIWLAAIALAAAYSLEVGKLYGFGTGALLFIALFAAEVVFFVWLLQDIVFKRGR